MSDGITMDLDARELDHALRAVVRETDRTMPKAIDRSMASILFRNKFNVIRKTVRTTAAKIKKDLLRGGGVMLAALAQKSLRKKGIKPTNPNITLEMDRILNKRMASARYLVAGWAVAAIMFGATRIKPVSPKSIAGKSEGRKATRGKVFSEASNAVAAILADSAAHAQAFNAMQKAVNYEASALLAYVEKKVGKAMKPYQPKGGADG